MKTAFPMHCDFVDCFVSRYLTLWFLGPKAPWELRLLSCFTHLGRILITIKNNSIQNSKEQSVVIYTGNGSDSGIRLNVGCPLFCSPFPRPFIANLAIAELTLHSQFQIKVTSKWWATVLQSLLNVGFPKVLAPLPQLWPRRSSLP